MPYLRLLLGFNLILLILQQVEPLLAVCLGDRYHRSLEVQTGGKGMKRIWENVAIFSLTTAFMGMPAVVLAQSTPQIIAQIIAQRNEADFVNRGLQRYRQGDVRGAIEDFSQALQLNPNYVQGYQARANLLSAQGNQQAAIADYSQALRLDAGFVPAYIGRASAQSAQGNHEAAIDDYSRALKLNNNYVQAYIGRSAAYAALKDFNRALNDLNQALGRDPSNGAAYYNRGSVFALQGDRANAMRDFQQAAEIFRQQQNPELYQQAMTRIQLLQMQRN